MSRGTVDQERTKAKAAGSESTQDISKVQMKHIAGPWISPDGDLIIQRCALCGFALIDCRASRMMGSSQSGCFCEVPGCLPGTCPNAPTEAPAIATWEMGAIIEVYGDGQPTQFRIVGSISGEENPHGNCSEIDELCIAERLTR